MITIGRIPQKLQRFFRPVKKQVSGHVYDYFWSFVLAMCLSHGSTIDKLVKLLRNSPHRTNHGEFLWRSHWGESAVLQQIALGAVVARPAVGVAAGVDRALAARTVALEEALHADERAVADFLLACQTAAVALAAADQAGQAGGGAAVVEVDRLAVEIAVL